MGFVVEQECPQCGVLIVLEETDHLLRCEYCGVHNYLNASDYFRFALPHKTEDRPLVHVPYLRFRGSVFYCHGETIEHRVMDITRLGAPLNVLPASLGIRPQAVKMKFAAPDMGGVFLKNSLKIVDALNKMGKRPSSSQSGPLYHRAYIGETISLIYQPLSIDNELLVDAVTNQAIARIPDGKNFFEPVINKNPGFRLSFIATLCPQCGWNLEGERDSVVLTCGNCNTAWAASKDRFMPVDFMVVPGQEDTFVHLPFWKITAASETVHIRSFADFVRVTNQPLVPQRQWERREMHYFVPAFKIRPKIFLDLASRLTISQGKFECEVRPLPEKAHPVTLPRSEAVQSLKITLAKSAMNKRDILPLLPRLQFAIKNITLCYLPFRSTNHELLQEQTGISINRKILDFGRKL